MTITIEHSLVRIYNSYGDPAGVGFSVAQGKLLTCAHVVISALELSADTTQIPNGVIHFDLPFVKARAKEIEQPGDARVVLWDIKNDIAVLEIVGDLHAKLKPVKFASSTMGIWEHKFRTFGFPINNDQGIWALGTLLEKNAFGWIQIQDTNDVKGYFVQPGFSGAPVWDETLKGVVGMIVAADNDEKRRVAYIIPLEFLPVINSPQEIESTLEKATRKLRVFLCHSSNDKPVVREVYKKLASEDWIDPWLDEEKILYGQEWDLEIERAVEASDAVIVFLSTGSITKEGYIQRELRFVLDIAQDKPESAIFIIPLRLDDCTPPRRLRAWQWGDYFPEEEREEKYQRLLKSLQVRYEQKFSVRIVNLDEKQPLIEYESRKTKSPKEQPKTTSGTNKVIPTNTEVSHQEWPGLPVPSLYEFIGEIESTTPHFFRPKDGHLAVLFSDLTVTGEEFLIDKYAITCKQYCNFLNELAADSLVQTQIRNDQYCAISAGHVLVIDCLDRWKKPAKDMPWLHASKPFGITYQHDCWRPLPGSELLPVTLITWWGARLYSLWVHHESTTGLFSYLPSRDQWLAAAQWDPKTRTRRRYPWGDNWNHLIVNFSGYYSGRNVTEANWKILWESNALAYTNTRPVPVAELSQNISPIGCVQMVGNTWEWTTSLSEERTIIQGGCATSPMEHCEPTRETKWPLDQTQECIGFRCCFPIRRHL
jgi:formylglycine-generating enzyme required for sulfatase activity